MNRGQTNPIPDAIVVARWKGSLFAFVENQTVCVHVESTTTDEQGRYRLPAWRKKSEIGWIRDLWPDITVYKPGYQWPERYEKNVQYLKPFIGERGGRFQSLWRIVSATGCQSAGYSSRNLHPLYESVYEESKPLVVTEEEKQKLQLIREIAAAAWIAEDRHMTTREAQKLIKEYLRDHLQ